MTIESQIGEKDKYTPRTMVNGMQIPSIILLGHWCLYRLKVRMYIPFILTDIQWNIVKRPFLSNYSNLKCSFTLNKEKSCFLMSNDVKIYFRVVTYFKRIIWAIISNQRQNCFYTFGQEHILLEVVLRIDIGQSSENS